MAPPAWLWKRLLRFSGNQRGQELLWRGVDLSLNLLGIGPGGFVVSSGEGALLGRLQKQHAQTGLPLCIFDVGAHHGEFLREVIQPLTELGLPYQTHAFEPSPVSYEVLRQAYGDRANFFLNNFALGAEPGESTLYADSAGSDLASLSRRRLDHFGMAFDHAEQVKVRTLDDYCLEKSVGTIDLLKLDVEGHELEVMQGASRMFREHRVRMMSFEFGGTNIDSRTFFQDYWYFINANRIGTIHRMTPSGYLAPVTEYKEIYEQFRPTVFVVLQPAD